MKLRGGVYKLKYITDNVSCTYIISSRNKFFSRGLDDLKNSLFDEIEPNFFSSYSSGDFLIAGYNFGTGSTREQSHIALKKAGINVVIAKSFAPVFYKNAFNHGMLLIECNTDYIEDRDEVEIDVINGLVRNVSKKIGIKMNSINPTFLRIFNDGGLIEHLKKNNMKYHCKK